MNKSNVFYVQYWMFGNCYLLNYPAMTNILAVNQIISQKVQGLQRNEDPTITNKFLL